MKKFELPEQPQKTNTSKDFTMAKEAITNLDKFDYVWKSYSHKLEKRFTAAIKYIEELERENQRLRAENLAVKTLVEDAKKQQPEIPEFVAAEIEEKNRRFSDFHKIANIEGYVKEVNDWYYEKPYHAELFYRAILDGYTVAKEKRFYLKHIDMSKKYNSTVCVLAHGEGDVIYGHYEFPVGVFPSESDYIFTQTQIDSMETGSYEQILVEENK